MAEDIPAMSARQLYNVVEGGGFARFLDHLLMLKPTLLRYAELEEGLPRLEQQHDAILAGFAEREGQARSTTDAAEADRDQRVAAAKAKANKAESAVQTLEAKVKTLTQTAAEIEERVRVARHELSEIHKRLGVGG